MPHAFGVLLAQLRRRVPGLSQARLAAKIGYDPAVLARLAQGHRDLTGPTGRAKVLRVISGLRQLGALMALDEANGLLAAAGMPPLFAGSADELVLLRELSDYERESGVPLPIPLTSILGRDAEVAALSELIAHERLVTICGPPGVGKTRLALEVAAKMTAQFANGVVFIDLSLLASHAFVLFALATSLRIQDAVNTNLFDRLRAAVRNRNLLLVLDNFEHVADAAPLIADLLVGAPKVHALVTSREHIRLRGEHVYRLEPLALHDGPAAATIDDIERYAALELFVARAHSANPRFQVTAESAALIGDLCRALDGLPLAIELTAARAEVALTPDAMTRIAADSSGELVARDLPARQRTLMSEIGWSYGLLSSDEQRAFRELGVLRGGCTLPQFSALCDWTNVADELLLSLVQKSLVHVTYTTDGRPVFVPYETVRVYARNAASASGQLSQLEARHASCYLAYVEEVASGLRQQGMLQRLADLDREQGNLQIALKHFQIHDTSDAYLRMTLGLARYWFIRGRYVEGSGHLKAALSTREHSPRISAEAQYWLGRMLRRMGDFNEAEAWLKLSQATVEGNNDHCGLARVLNEFAAFHLGRGAYGPARAAAEHAVLAARDAPRESAEREFLISDAELGLAQVAMAQNDFAVARELAISSAARARLLGEASVPTYALYLLGWLETRIGNHDSAGLLLQEALQQSRMLGERKFVAVMHSMLGEIYRHARRTEDAREHLDRGLGMYREFGEMSELNWPLCNLAYIALDIGEIAKGEMLLLESLNLRRIHAYHRGLAYVYVGFARIRIGQRRDIDAAFWLGAARAEARHGGQAFDIAEQSDIDAATAYVDTHVDVATRRAADEAAAALNADELAHYALTSLR